MSTIKDRHAGLKKTADVIIYTELDVGGRLKEKHSMPNIQNCSKLNIKYKFPQIFLLPKYLFFLDTHKRMYINIYKRTPINISDRSKLSQWCSVIVFYENITVKVYVLFYIMRHNLTSILNDNKYVLEMCDVQSFFNIHCIHLIQTTLSVFRFF